MKKFAYFTVASDDFTPGVYCLAKSLKKITQYPFHVISINITEENKKKLQLVGCNIIDTEYLGSKTCKPQPYRENPNFANNCYNKIHLWNQDFDKIIYFDADTVVIKNIDHLFEIEADFAAGASFQTILDAKTRKPTRAGWRGDYFNSGVMILKPDKKIFEELVKMKDIIETPKDPSDQGLLNHYFFKKWFRLKPIYNFTRRVFDVAPIKWRELRNEICVIHYTLEKPWKKREDTEINKLWWEINDSANILS